MALPTAPVLLLAQGFQRRAALLEVGVERARVGSPPGLVLSWDDVPDRAVRDEAASASWPAPLMLDPGGHRYDRPTIGRGAGAATAPWIGRPAPTSEASWDQAASEALRAQRMLAGEPLIVPTVELGAPDWPDGLESALNAARRAYRNRLASDSEFAVRLCLRDEWLSDLRRRRTLLTELTDLPDERGIALHVRWARSDLLDDAPTIERLRQCVSVLASDGRRVIVLQSGLLGWLALAWGAWGFGAGLSQVAWHDST